MGTQSNPTSFPAAMKHFFTYNGGDMKSFVWELSALTDEDKAELKVSLITLGYFIKD